MRSGIKIALGLGALAGVALLLSGGERESEPKESDVSAKPKPLYVSERGDPELESLLQQMDDEFASAGIRDFSAAEVTKMRKTPGPSYAIPPRSYWPRMIDTLELVQSIRDAWGQPISVYNGFRPEDYNKAVGGAPGSRHQWFEAVDLMPTGDRDDFATLVAMRFTAGEPDMGFGVYGKPGHVTGVHIDTHRRRTWGIAQHYIQRAAQA